MDLLGSILGSMDKSAPPQASEKGRLEKKKQKEMVVKMEERNRAAKIRFRSKVEAKLGAFQSDSEAKTLKFPPMDRYQRSVVHDVAEIAGLATYSFGEEEVDRFIQVWKKEFSPCEGELAALRKGEEWDPVKALQEQQEEEWRSKLELERSRTLNKVQPKTT